MISALLLIITGFLSFVLLWRRSTLKPDGFPPGLPRLPVVGSVPFLMSKGNNRDVFPRLAREMGPCIGLYLGNLPCVVISDADLIREAMKQELFAKRLDIRPLHELRFGGEDGSSRGIILSNGREWQEQRRFTLRQLRNFGFGKASMNDIIVTEADKLIQFLLPDVGKPIDLAGKLNLSILNALWVVLTGEHLQLDDPRLGEIVRRFNRAIKESQSPFEGIALLNIPWLTKRFHPLFKNLYEAMNDTYKLIDEVIKEHEDTIDPNQPRDFMDVYLNEIHQCQDPESSFYKENGLKSLKTVMMDLFIAGMETTSSSLLWTLIFLLKNPETQRRVHEELDSVIGGGRSIGMEDREQLVYTQAVIHESMRLATLVPLSVPHVAAQDTFLKGHFIPQGTLIMPNLAHVHMDEHYWGDPKHFRPERFLSADGRQVVMDDHLMPFSVGKRFCMGQTLAEKEFFIFFANLMANFEFATPDNKRLELDIALDADHGKDIIRNAPAFDVVLTRRQWSKH